MINLDINTETTTKDYNLPLYGIRGEFSLSANVSVPYFSTLMDLKRVAHELKTHEEIAPSLENTYTLAELFQREIDIVRVTQEIVNGYLKSPTKLKFFNALTIVLIPKDEHGRSQKDFEDYPDNDPEIPYTSADVFDRGFVSAAVSRVVFGGVQFVTTKAADIARLRWDRRRVDAMVVDGQHRLTAIKEWLKSKNGELTDYEKPTRIPVLFLLLDSKAGFKGSSADQAPAIKVIAREIFTDLNKNAKEVDLATQIILDDRSLESCCVRSLITTRTCEDHETLLPLSLLRWREANNRFDTRYYLNSLINIHLIVEEIIGLDLPSNPMDKPSVVKYITAAERALGTESNGAFRLELKGKSLQEYYDETFFDHAQDEKDTPIAPFVGIPQQYLPSAVEGFKQRYSHWLLTLLRDFKPYKLVLEYARANKLIQGPFAQFLSQPKTAREALNIELESIHGDGWHDDLILMHDRAIEEIKAARNNDLGEQWAFKTIFQKAMVRLGKQVCMNLTPDESTRLGGLPEYLSFINHLYDQEILRVYAQINGRSHLLWTFIALNYGSRKIRVSSKTEDLIEGILRVWYFGSRYLLSEGKVLNNEDEAKTAYHTISTAASHALWMCRDDLKAIREVFKLQAHVIDPAVFEPERLSGMTDDQIEKLRDKISLDRISAVLYEGWKPANASEGKNRPDSHDDEMI
jgi:hypothetical protein